MSEDYNTEEMPSFLDFDIDNAVEPEVLAEGEYNFQIIGAKVGLSQKEGSGRYLKLTFKPIGTDLINPKLVSHVIMLPDSTQDAETNNKRLLDLSKFYKAFDVPRDENNRANLEDMKGLEGAAFVVVKNSDQYGQSNEVRRFV